ncbi:hypothetical protein [Leifsonia xyli]|uniref:hypothetical protein n=1 Tax=Leifsonia xyli TaxID=1575 RepID=UPI00114D1513|nr:hypothetical protein [Leifsonia xyli]
MNCTWRIAGIPDGEIREAGEHGARTTVNQQIEDGDSGEPVYKDGIVYGVVGSNLVDDETHEVTMTYISAGQFMLETNSGYYLAPPD